MKTITTIVASMLVATSATAMTFAEKEAVVDHAYVMEVSKGEPMMPELRAHKEAMIKHAYVMEAKPCMPDMDCKVHEPEMRALKEAKVKHAHEWK